MFISTGHGFKLILPNNWMVSVQFGMNHYCEQRSVAFRTLHQEMDEIKEKGQWASKDAEVAVIDPQGKFVNIWYSTGDDVMGWLTMDKFLPILFEVSQYGETQSIKDIDPSFGRNRAEVLRNRTL